MMPAGAMMERIARHDHRLMRRVHHWRPPRWVRLWMICATRCGDGWVWYAQGIAIIPGVLKAGFVIGGKAGHGVVFSRTADGTWGGPAFVTIGGASLGLQAGVQSTDVVLVFKTRRSLERVVQGKGKLTLGADVAIAAGPIGREAAAGTDIRLRAEIFSYSRSRGLFAGVSFDGAAIVYDYDANQAFAQNQSPPIIALVEKLRAQIIAASDPKSIAPVQMLPPALPPPPKW